jgi:two-component system, sensor histidine kinase PdtaS
MFEAQLFLWAPSSPAWEQLAVVLKERGYLVLGPLQNNLDGPEHVTLPDLILCAEELSETELSRPPFGGRISSLSGNAEVFLADPTALFVRIEMALRFRLADLTLGETRIRQLLEYLSDTLVILSPDGLPRYLSPAIERVTGFTPFELMGKTAFEIVHPEDIPKVAEGMVWSRNHPGEPVMFEFRHKHKNGGYVLMESVGQSLLDVPGIEASVVISRDISQRRQLESKIQDSEKRYRIVAEQTGQMIYDWDVSTGEIEWVGAIESITGFDPVGYQDVNIEVWESMIHEDERAETLAVLDQAARADGHFSMEYRIRRKDDSYIWVEDTGLFLKDETGMVIRMLGSMKNISRRRRGDALLQSAFNEREILLQEIHHRVKNNFQIMISLLNMQIRRAQFTEVEYSLKDVRRRLRSMLLVHEELYDQGSSAIVNFSDYLNVLSHELYSQHLGAIQVQLELALQPLVLRMEQAVPCGLIANELLTNAFKYAFAQMNSEAFISLRLLAEAGDILLEISDNGQGLPQNIQYGLGLHLVERLARQLEGTCSLLTQDQGVTWLLRFPYDAIAVL